jgi:hypothetical protein
MKEINIKISGYFSMAVMMFAVLFDPTEVALGLMVFPNISEWVTTLATIIGNVTWLFGLILLVGIVYMTLVLLIDDLYDKIIKSIIMSGNITRFVNLSGWNTFRLILFTTCSLVAIGSGFWFVGLTWLIMLQLTFVYSRRIRNSLQQTQSVKKNPQESKFDL